MDNLILLRHSKKWGFCEEKVVDLARKALIKRGFEGGVELSIWFVGRTRAKKLNQHYRGKDYIPQVLGFPMSTESDIDGVIRLGDVVICTQKLRYEAGYQQKSVDEVMEEWILHGVDNLLKEGR